MMASTQLDVYRADIETIVRDVFDSMLGLETSLSDLPWAATPGHLTAAVYFSGEWDGAVLVECGRATARHLTARLMPIPEEDQTPDDIQDALGELANMIGGNLKSVMPRGVSLSMPSVVDGSSYSVRVCGSNLTQRRAFACDAGPFWVTLVEVVPR